MRPWFIAVLSVAAAVRLCAVEPPPPGQAEPSADLQFRVAYGTLARGDEERDRGNPSEAILLYKEALTAYTKLAAKYPDWQPGVVRFRINYCGNQIETLVRQTQRAASRPAGASEQSSETGEKAALSLPEIKASAARLLIKGETAKARVLLEEGRRLDPTDASVRLLFAMTQCQAGEFASASNLTQQVIDESPSNACAHVVMGTACFALGKRERAEKELQLALESNPALKSAHYDMARLLLMAQPPDRQGAQEHYDKAVQLGAEPDRSLELVLKELSEPNAPPSPVRSPRSLGVRSPPVGP